MGNLYNWVYSRHPRELVKNLKTGKGFRVHAIIDNRSENYHPNIECQIKDGTIYNDKNEPIFSFEIPC